MRKLKAVIWSLFILAGLMGTLFLCGQSSVMGFFVRPRPVTDGAIPVFDGTSGIYGTDSGVTPVGLTNGLASTAYVQAQDVITSNGVWGAVTTRVEGGTADLSAYAGDNMLWDAVDNQFDAAAGGSVVLAYTNVTTLTSAAIQGAIDALSSTYGGGRINLTRGTYVMAAAGINVSNNIEIVGSGWGTILDSTGQVQTDDVIDIVGTNVVLRDFKILSDRAGGTVYNQVCVTANGSDAKLGHLALMTSDNDAVDIISGASRVSVDGCYIYDPDEKGIDDNGTGYNCFSCNYLEGTDNDGIDNNGQRSKITDNTVASAGADGIEAGNYTTVKGNFVLTCAGVGMRGGSGSVISGNEVLSCTQDGIRISSDQIVCNDNHCYENGNGFADIKLAGVNHGSIQGNVCSGNSGKAEQGIHADGCTDLMISGNVSYDHDTCGIQIDADCATCVVANNNTDDETTPTVIGAAGDIISMNKHTYLTLPKDVGCSIVGTNLASVTTCRLMAGFGQDVTFTSGHAICPYGTGIVHFVEAATNSTPTSFAVTNTSITATTTGAAWSGSFVVEATNALYMILQGDALSNYPTNTYHGTLQGTYRYIYE